MAAPKPRYQPTELPRALTDTLLQEAVRKGQIHPAGVVPQLMGGLMRDPGVGQSAGPPGLAQEPQLVHEPGTNVMAQFLHPAYMPVVQEYRANPQDSWYSRKVSPSAPVQFGLGAFKVPQGMQYWIYEFAFNAFRQSGVDPGDAILAEEGRFSTALGFDLTIGGSRPTSILYQLRPVPVQTQRQAYQPQGAVPPGDPAPFVRANAGLFGATAGPGLSLLPPGTNTIGPRNAPFTLIAREQQVVNLQAVVFSQLSTPLVAIAGQHRGYLIHTQTADAMINRVRPR